MSLFDTYIPKAELLCSVCNARLIGWQGTDGPCGLFVWEEQVANPVGQQAGDSNLCEKKLSKVQLPEQFDIYSDDCACSFPNVAKCKTLDGVWAETTLITALNIQQEKHETKARFKQRLKWLESRN